MCKQVIKPHLRLHECSVYRMVCCDPLTPSPAHTAVVVLLLVPTLLTGWVELAATSRLAISRLALIMALPVAIVTGPVIGGTEAPPPTLITLTADDKHIALTGSLTCTIHPLYCMIS